MKSASRYRTIKTEAGGCYKEKGSKFISYAFPVESEEKVREIMNDLRKKHHDARHHCYAFVLSDESTTSRACDDGEPRNSAGKPILDQIQSRKLKNILVVVIRYFGGTLLGVGGLARAYKKAAEDALDQVGVVVKYPVTSYMLNFDYSLMNQVMTIIKDEKISILEHKTGMQSRMHVEIPDAFSQRITQRLRSAGANLVGTNGLSDNN